MKRLIGMVLSLVLLVCCIAVSAAAEEYVDYTCAEENFSTKIPLAGSSGYETNTGLVIYTEHPGYIPYVIVHRRALDRKFNNPVNYLNNVMREYLEEKHADLATNPAKTWEIGGKKLLGARYMYKINKYTVYHLHLIEIRDGGDVEYTAKYLEGEDKATMAALEEAVRNYQETDTDQPDQALSLNGEQIEGVAEYILEPVNITGQEVDLQNGTYWAKITDTKQIKNTGYFTVELYEEDYYEAADVEALRAGSRFKLNGEVYTVDSIQPWLEDSSLLWVIPKEEFSGWMGFEKAQNGYYYGVIGDWHVSSFVTDTIIQMPLPDAFVFAYALAGDDVRLYNADSFVQIAEEEILFNESDLTPDRTAVRFTDGLLTVIAYYE